MAGVLILVCPEGGHARATMSLTTALPNEMHTLRLVTSRNWIDLSIGTAIYLDDIRAKTRLEPGEHFLSFIPGMSPYIVTVERNREGKAAIIEMEAVGAVGDMTLTTPYTEDQLRDLRLAQIGDVRWVWVRGVAPHAVVRRGNNSWSFQAWRADDGPFLPENLDAVTVTPDGRHGEVNLEFSEDVLDEGHVGALWRIAHQGQVADATLNSADSFTESIRVVGVEDDRKFPVVITGTFSGTLTLQRSFGAPDDWRDWKTYTAAGSTIEDDGFDNQIVYYRIGFKAGQYTSGSAVCALTFAIGETVGVVRIVEVFDAQNALADVIETLGATTATRTWSEGAWSTLRGWPEAGVLADGRLQLVRGTDFFASGPDDFIAFSTGSEDDDGIARVMALQNVAPPEWIKHIGRTLVGTQGSEPQIRSSAFDEPITPANMTLRELSNVGSANIDAVVYNGQVVFVDRTGMNLFALTYDPDTTSFTPLHLNRLHEDIAGAGGFLDMALQAKPSPRFWLPCADGQMVVLTFEPAEQVVSFARIITSLTTDGDDDIRLAARDKFESVCSIPSGGREDWVHALVRREIDGEVIRCHERFEPLKWWDGRSPTAAERAAACRVHCGVFYDGAAARFISGLDHLLGETVAVWGDGADVGEFEVETLGAEAGALAGEIGVDLGAGIEVETAWIGLPYTGRRKSTRLPYGAQIGSAVGEVERFDHIAALIYKTQPGSLHFGWAFDDMKRLADLRYGFSMDGAPDLFTGVSKFALNSGHLRDPRLCIEMVGAGPAAVLGIVLQGEAHENL